MYNIEASSSCRKSVVNLYVPFVKLASHSKVGSEEGEENTLVGVL